MVVVSARLALRMFVASAFVVFALVFLAGRAHADDVTPTDPPAAQSDAPPADTSTTPPADTSTAPPADSSNTPTPAPDQTQSSTPASDTQSTPPPSGASAQPTPSTPAGADGPKNTNDQNATVGTTGTSLSNTGGNATDATGNPTTPATTGSGTTNGTITSGTSDATGTNSGSAIDQSAQATATDQGKVDILQIGLIVNVGVANSNSGSNTVGVDGSGSGGTGSTTTNTKTGNASSTGDQSKTGVTQSAVLQPGDNSQQKAMVVNVGIAIGNTGLNITIGTMNGAGTLSSGNTTGQITSGNSKAIGDQSQSQITQRAGGMASGTATLTIDQRAIIVNFGTAFSNTGGNFAFARFDPTGLTPEERDIVEAVLSVLAPFFAPHDGTAGTGTTTAKIGTGNATAIGNASTTDINQMAIGNLTGDQQASSHQTAVVGNLGIALANTGFNGSLANVPNGGLPSSNPELLAAQNALAQFLGLLTNLDWLNSPNPFAQFQQTVNLGGVTLELGGSLQGADFMLGWDSGFAPDGGPLPGGVRVRQISGVINIGISLSNTGDNTVVAIVSANHDASGTSLKSGNGIKNGSPDVLSRVLSGDATAIGNHSIVTVCQAFHDTVTCAPKVNPGGGGGGGGTTGGDDQTPPPPGGVSVSPAVVTASASDGTLPFTGGAPRDFVEVAGALLGVGALMSSRRKRRERV